MPPFLYKYYPWNPYYDEFRINGGLYFASPAKFNDLLDCKMPIINNINRFTKEQVLPKIAELYPADDVDIVYSDIVNNSQWRIEEYYRKQQDKLESTLKS